MKDSKTLYIFLAKAAGLYLLWEGITALFLAPNGPVNRAVTYNIALFGAAVLRLFGYNSQSSVVDNMYNVISLDGKYAVSIEDGCNGLVLMFLFAGFVIAYPGPLKKKLWYIPAGLAVIYMLNIVRVVALVINHKVSASTFDFNHKFTFTTTLYAVIFALWMLWANKFAKVGSDDESTDTGTVPAGA